METLGVLLLFAAGLRLSAFFSGSETGFYRLSLPRLGIDAQSGDTNAARILWFANRPSQFVATTLVGNNVANYLTTLAITNGTLLLFGHGWEMAEVLATLAISPLIFLFGELLPKNVYYRAPLARMRREIFWFQLFYWIALPVSAPLVLLTRLVERLLGTESQSQEMLPGRGRFMQMIGHGHSEGLLTRAQSTMATSVLSIAVEPAVESMTPTSRALGLREQTTRDEIVNFARKYGTPLVTLSSDSGAVDHDIAGHDVRWTSYVGVAELCVRTEPVAELKREMPRIPSKATKLEALAALHERSAVFGAVVDESGRVLGTVSRRGLVEQLFRPHPRGHASTHME